VVSAVEEQGVKAVDAMLIFAADKAALFRWLNSHRSGGIGSLILGRCGRSKGHTKFKPHQATAIVRQIMVRCPDQLKAIVRVVNTGSGARVNSPRDAAWAFPAQPCAPLGGSGRFKCRFAATMRKTRPSRVR